MGCMPLFSDMGLKSPMNCCPNYIRTFKGKIGDTVHVVDVFNQLLKIMLAKKNRFNYNHKCSQEGTGISNR